MRPRAVLADVGFTLTFCDGAAIAELARAAGVEVAPAAVEGAEPTLRRELDRYTGASSSRTERPAGLSPTGGVQFFRRLLELASPGADLDGDRLELAARAVWDGHLERNVWRRVGDGVAEAARRLRAAGV